jgi:hypothetical protein
MDSIAGQRAVSFSLLSSLLSVFAWSLEQLIPPWMMMTLQA